MGGSGRVLEIGEPMCKQPTPALQPSTASIVELQLPERLCAATADTDPEPVANTQPLSSDGVLKRLATSDAPENGTASPDPSDENGHAKSQEKKRRRPCAVVEWSGAQS